MRARAWAPRLPLPLRRAPRVLAARLAVVAFAAGVVFAARVALATGGEAFLEPRGRPGLRRGARDAGADAPFVDAGMPSRAAAAASRRLYSSTTSFSSASRASISLRLSVRKSVTVLSSAVGGTWHKVSRGSATAEESTVTDFLTDKRKE